LGHYWDSCRCESVDVDYVPGHDTMQLATYVPIYYGIFHSGHRFGCRVHVSWNVSGAPFRCRYFQDEEGTVVTAVGPGGLTMSKAGKNGEVTNPKYTDYQGVDFSWVMPGGPEIGTWTETVHWDVRFRCESSRGSRRQPVIKHDVFPNVTGTIAVPWW
jgi:hypothetical protein